MHITIDTNNITEQDREILAKILGPVNFAAFKQETPAAEPEKPKRTRRTKAEMEAARAAEQAEAKAKIESGEIAPTNPPKEESERVADLAVEASQDEEPDAERAADSVSPEELKDLATQLITKDRQAMVDLLKSFNARRLAEIPEQDHGKFAAELRSKLA